MFSGHRFPGLFAGCPNQIGRPPAGFFCLINVSCWAVTRWPGPGTPAASPLPHFSPHLSPHLSPTFLVFATCLPRVLLVLADLAACQSLSYPCRPDMFRFSCANLNLQLPLQVQLHTCAAYCHRSSNLESGPAASGIETLLVSIICFSLECSWITCSFHVLPGTMRCS